MPTLDNLRGYNFSAGPGTLPEEVLLEVKNELPVYESIGSSVLEISHRSATYTDIAEMARTRLRKLLGLGEEWHILFLQGGASMQFFQVPYNFLTRDTSADYLVTGTWSVKAVKEAKLIGGVREAASSKDKSFSYVPEPASWELDENAAYLHFTSNNTVAGTQFHQEPEVTVPLVCDASSDFLSRHIDLDRYGLIYAGAQKNIGPAGVTVVLIKESFLQNRNNDLPSMLDYGIHTAKLFNTPPVFAVYLVEKVLRWLEGKGGIDGIQAMNEEKAQRLYARIDASDFYRGTVENGSRSIMNVCFRLPEESLEKKFVADAAENGLLALKGHRSVGGMRASIYNACPLDAVNALVSFMDEFERKNG